MCWLSYIYVLDAFIIMFEMDDYFGSQAEEKINKDMIYNAYSFSKIKLFFYGNVGLELILLQWRQLRTLLFLRELFFIFES